MATQAEMEAAWEVYLSVDPQTWGISHMKAALEAAERASWQPSDYPAKPGNEIEAAATQIHYEMGCTITAARIAAAKALKAAERARWQPIETAPEGEHILLWWPVGEKGVGGMECATIFRNLPDEGHSPTQMGFWTHGGPNGGLDWEPSDNEKPSHWQPLPSPPESK